MEQLIHLVKPGHIRGNVWPTMCGLTVNKSKATMFQSRTTCQNCIDSCSVLLPGQTRSGDYEEDEPVAKPPKRVEGRATAPAGAEYDWG